MTDFSKDSQEYISNGHYEIDGTQFMSVYTFKKKNKMKAVNSKMEKVNPNEGMELAAKCQIKYKTKPDFGHFDFIWVYPVTELEDYYGV